MPVAVTFPHYCWEPVNVFDVGYTKPTFRPATEQTNIFVCHQARRNVKLLIQEARQRKGLTQKQLARIVNLKWTVVQELESSNNVEIDTDVLDVVCRALNIKRE
jgi:ribosome-binding protein aMBF1 (putative translation factor)